MHKFSDDLTGTFFKGTECTYLTLICLVPILKRQNARLHIFLLICLVPILKRQNAHILADLSGTAFKGTECTNSQII